MATPLRLMALLLGLVAITAPALRAQDVLTVGTVSAFQGATVEVPIHVRDLSATPLGVDRPAGSRIQGMVFKVFWTPAASVTAVSASRAGITAGLTPLFETATATDHSVSFLASFAEATDPLPFNLDGAAPGDQVAKLTLTLAPDAPPGNLALNLEPAVTELSNQAGTLAENEGNSGLVLVPGAITVLPVSATGLYAAAQSTSEVRLTWIDPRGSETGFRIERSTDGASWSPVATVGPDNTGFLDQGLAPASLFYYRVVVLLPSGDGPPSNRAAVSTFPAVAAKVCMTRLSGERTWARFPTAAFNGSHWAVAWQERMPGSTNEEIILQFLDPADGTPVGTPLRITETDPVSQFPTLRWNGSHFGLLWTEHMRGEPGAPRSTLLFALLDADGNKVRGDVRIYDTSSPGLLTSSGEFTLIWDGTHWGLFDTSTLNPPYQDLIYTRLTQDGDRVLGPVPLTGTPSRKWDVAAAWSPVLGKYGVAWGSKVDSTVEIYFQRVEETTGAAEGSPVKLAEFASDLGSDGVSVVWDGTGWAVAWTQVPPDDSEYTVWLRRLDAAGSPLGPARRLSNDFDPNDPPFDEVPTLAVRPGGGYTVFTSSFSNFSGAYEIGRLQADTDGEREGNRVFLSNDDGRDSSAQRLATDGSRFLLAYQDSRVETQEVTALLLDASGAPVATIALTGGHSPGNVAFGVMTAAHPFVAPLGEGFLTLWTDSASGTNRVEARTFDGTGAVIADAFPFPLRGRPGVAVVGDTFAVAGLNGNVLLFARYDANGTPLIPEIEVATGAPFGRAEVTMGFSGEVFGLFWNEAQTLMFQRVAPDGTLVGPKVPTFTNVAGAGPQVQWVGRGWALLWRRPDNNLYYGLIGPEGQILVPATALTATVTPAILNNQFNLFWTGEHLGVTWSEYRGIDPPGRDVYFTVLGLDGAKAFPEVAVGTPYDDVNPRLYWTNGRFRLIFSDSQGTSGFHEIEVLPDGTVLPGERFLSNRQGNPAVAFNGATLGLAWVPGSLREVFFETTACLDDTTAPVCPALNAASQNDKVFLFWSPVADPESGLLRYHLYRDGTMLSELFPATTGFLDGGYRVGTTHVYEVRAMNGAFQESGGCSPLAFSTVAGDANGDGGLDAADVFYLINHLLAGGPPPGGDADANGDGAVTVTDLFFLINYLFAGGPQPRWLGEVP